MKLEDLLLEAEVLSHHRLHEARHDSLFASLPLGKMLVLSSTVDEELIGVALNILVRHRDDAMFTTDDAVLVLRTFQEKRNADAAGLDLRPFILPVSNRGICLGQLLLRAGYVEQDDIFTALELSLVQRPVLLGTGGGTVSLSQRGPLIGQTLLEMGSVSAEILGAALRAQDSVAGGSMTVEEAVDSF